MPKRQPHLYREKNRHGNNAWYVRRGHGPRIRIRAEYDTPEFWEAYRATLAGQAPVAKGGVRPHTLQWELDRYRRSSAWAQLATSTRRQKENIFRIVCATAGDELLSAINEESIRQGRERRKHTPHSANVFLKAMRSFFAWAIEEGLVTKNPAANVKLLKGENDNVGFHTWTPAELSTFEARWPVGTRERLAYDLLLYTGLRRGDAVRIGKQHVRDSVISIRAEKTGEELFLPILPPLAASIAAAPTGDLAFLVTSAGEPWVKESFGNWFKSACRKAGVPGSAHGLRKAGSTRAAENGATDRELMALYGWTSEKQPTRYTKAADRKRLALAAAQRLLVRQANAEIPHLDPGAGNSANSAAKTTA